MEEEFSASSSDFSGSPIRSASLCPSEANCQQFPCSRAASPQSPPFSPPTFVPACFGFGELLDCVDRVNDSYYDEGSAPPEFHTICTKGLNDRLLLHFHWNQQTCLLDVAALLEQDQLFLFQATHHLLDDVAAAVEERLEVDLQDVQSCIRFGVEHNWEPAEQSFRRHTTALVRTASESEHIRRLLHNRTFGIMADRANIDPLRRSLRKSCPVKHYHPSGPT